MKEKKLTHTDLIQTLKKKVYHPLYLLEGEEPYFIDLVCDFMEQNILPESERSFNQTILYGKETTALDIRTRAMNYPMFSNYQVIIVKEAQALKKWDDLVPYFEKPVKTTILIICYKYDAFDKRTKAAKEIQKNGIVLTTKKFYDNQLPSFVINMIEEKGLKINASATNLIVEYIGNDLSRISNEIDKLKLNLKGRTEITADDIEKNIGISKEYNVFELNKALAIRDIQKANRIVNYFNSNEKSNPIVVTIGALYGYFVKVYLLHKCTANNDNELAGVIGVHPFVLNEYKAAARSYSAEKVESVISLLSEYDMRSKGVNDSGTTGGALLKELVYKILH